MDDPEELRRIHSDHTQSQEIRGLAMDRLRSMGEERDRCPFSGKRIPWRIGDIVCPACRGSGEGDAKDGSCVRCEGFSVVDELNPGERKWSKKDSYL